LRESSPFRGTWVGKEFKKDPISVASVYRRSGYVSDAEDYLKDFLSSHKIIPGSDPGSRKSSQLSEIHFFLGEIFAEEKKFKDSLTQFKAASHLNPSSKSMLMRKIYALAQAGNNKSAIEEALGTVKRFPNDPNALTLLGDVYYTLGQSLPASEAFTKALKVNSKTIPALRGLALIRSTAEEEGLRDGKEAVRLAEFLMSSPGASQNPDFIRILAAAHLESGEYMKSKILAEKALRMAHEQSMLSLINEIESLLILIREKGK
jgi:tetratricopeptide (TPR) repeat protein